MLRTAVPAIVKELVLKNSTNCTQMLAENPEKRFRDDECFESICILGRRRKKLTLDCSIDVERFLTHALQSKPSSPWRLLRHLSIIDSFVHDRADTVHILDVTGALVLCMPVLETLDMKLLVLDEEANCPVSRPVAGIVDVKVGYIKTSNNDDHMLLAIETPLDLEAGHIAKWERAAKEGRGAYLKVRIAIIKEDNEFEKDHS